MKTFRFNLFSGIFLILFTLFFVYAALTSQKLYFDTSAGIESARALLSADPYSYDLHTWRPPGQVLYHTLLGYFDFDSMIESARLFSVLWTVLGILAIARLSWLWAGSQWITLAILLSATSKIILHFGPSGTIDIQHFALVPLAWLALVDPKAPTKTFYRLCLYSFFMSFAASTRPTFFALGVLTLFLYDWKKLSFTTLFLRQCFLSLTFILFECFQLLYFVLLRGREYGWLTFKSANLGLIGYHTKAIDYPRSIAQFFELFIETLHFPLLFIGLLGIALSWRNKAPWSLFPIAWVIWCLGHVAIISRFEGRYFVTALAAFVPAICYWISTAQIQLKRCLIAILLFPSIPTLYQEIPLHLLLFHRKPFELKVLKKVESWQPRQDRLFWRGQFFTTVPALHPKLPHGSFYSIYSVAPTAFNIYLKSRVQFWHPKIPINWSELNDWKKGLLTETMIEKILDRDIFIISPAAIPDTMHTLPPIGSLKEINKFSPEDYHPDHLPPVQFPLIVQRVRRQWITEREGFYYAGSLKLQGAGMDQLSGWPYEGKILKQRERYELIWIDRLALFNRLGEDLLSKSRK